MSAVCMRVERAFARWLLGAAPYLVAADGSYVLTDKGMRVTLHTGPQFFLAVNRGQDDVEIASPGLIAACDDAVQTELTALNFLVNLQIELRYPVDEGPESCGLLEAFEYAARQLGAALYKTELMDEVSQSEPEFTALNRPAPWREQSGFTGRQRTYRWVTQVSVALSDLGLPT